ncbi:hypothetical protein M3484_19535 [Pseudomonas sp. GX19020]|uniref:hypothetical protein n=1 Tax=Pseudomonas sp. GX19020 TaxID=2942277 RepID=UPI0020185445|nr:hypothetical protein [Pseudomonas sp. GX19020]MCL4068760.1 hypothetical protein [Pseudomonas sp. GX19020]
MLRLIEGAVSWQRDDLRIPAKVEQVSSDYLDAEDIHVWFARVTATLRSSRD